ANVNTLDVHVGAVKGSACRRRFEWFAAELARSKTKIGAAAHRVRNSRHSYLARKIRLRVGNELFVTGERRQSQEVSRTEAIERGLNRGVVVAGARFNKREANAAAVSFRQVPVRYANLSIVHSYRCRQRTELVAIYKQGSDRDTAVEIR